MRLVDDLLDVSRITADKIQLRREPLDLARVVATAVESIAPLAASADQTLDVQLPSTPVWINGDGTRLVQVLVNILNNASKFTPPGGRISLTAERELAGRCCACAIQAWALAPMSCHGSSTCFTRRNRRSIGPPADWASG